jgi:hypothetical protein
MSLHCILASRLEQWRTNEIHSHPTPRAAKASFEWDFWIFHVQILSKLQLSTDVGSKAKRAIQGRTILIRLVIKANIQ